MADKCEIVDSCPFFEIFGTAKSRLKKEYVEKICNDKSKCKRIGYVNVNEKKPPDNMSPTGRLF